MNEIEEIKIKNMIYEISSKQVILDLEMSTTKCDNYLNYKIITYYNIDSTISVFSKYMSTKFRKEINIW